VVLEGNPADSELTEMMLDRQEAIYGRYPLKAAFDGGFASHTNLEKAKSNGVKHGLMYHLMYHSIFISNL
jgi:hypothetical protein